MEKTSFSSVKKKNTNVYKYVVNQIVKMCLRVGSSVPLSGHDWLIYILFSYQFFFKLENCYDCSFSFSLSEFVILCFSVPRRTVLPHSPHHTTQVFSSLSSYWTGIFSVRRSSPADYFTVQWALLCLSLLQSWRYRSLFTYTCVPTSAKFAPGVCVFICFVFFKPSFSSIQCCVESQKLSNGTPGETCLSWVLVCWNRNSGTPRVGGNSLLVFALHSKRWMKS